MTFDFKTQLRVGRAGEKFLEKHWHLPVIKNPDIKGWDYQDSSGAKIELKSDQYEMGKTPNFFLERYSDMLKLSPGGPWQAHAKGATVFVYLYSANRIWYICRDIPALLAKLDVLLVKDKGIQIPNRGYTTLGHKVPRAALAEHFTKEALP
jgi:hypothetical protein